MTLSEAALCPWGRPQRSWQLGAICWPQSLQLDSKPFLEGGCGLAHCYGHLRDHIPVALSSSWLGDTLSGCLSSLVSLPYFPKVTSFTSQIKYLNLNPCLSPGQLLGEPKPRHTRLAFRLMLLGEGMVVSGYVHLLFLSYLYLGRLKSWFAQHNSCLIC